MNDRRIWKIERQLLLGTLVCAVLLIVCYLTLVSTVWGHQFDDDGLLARKLLNWRIIKLDSDILDLVNKAALLAAAIALLIVAIVRRCILVGVISVAGFGSAVVGAEVLKHALPWRALISKDLLLESGFQRNTYPSGHATIATSLVLSLLLVSSPRWRPWLAVAGGSVSSTFATGVLFAGWHRPSDAIGALAWSGLCMSVAAACATRLRGRPKPVTADLARAVFASLALAIVVVAGTWLIAAAGAPEYSHADQPFFLLTALMIVGAFSLIGWYAWQLRAVDWVGPAH
jgi:PAP2 superfamily